MSSAEPPGRTPIQVGLNVLGVLGVLVMIAGAIGVVMGFAGFGQDDMTGTDHAMALFGGGAFAVVIGFGIVAFTRASMMTRRGAYTRVTIEQGVPPTGARACPSCGHPTAGTARFCDACGHALG